MTMKPLNDTCRQLLNKLGRTHNAGVVLLVGLLADALEESDHPTAKRVRKLWLTHQRREDWAATHSFGKRTYWTRPLWIGSWRQSLRRKVGKIFGRGYEPRRYEVFG